MITPVLPAILLGYLLGAVPFALVLTRAAGYGDIRRIGSGNIGATNVLRTGNKPLAAAVLLLDAGKGALAYGLALAFAPTAALAAGVAAVVGHLFPVYLKFRGGKGVATFLGLVIAVDWRLGAAACAAWVATALAFRFSSLAALVAVTVTPVAAYLLVGIDPAVALLALALVITWRHKANIQRLAAGTEPRIGAK
ncbi:acyl-phosphate glycerol-3-phosphate acyltransferase [Rhodothalassium salexigens DSM 2132]|uniref:Glycerol-3-phosphate acyltransferase n=1 Tax=Rhodothalassium salexigens DSM 2132 TaxID=1188247 RepID=A0A4R2PRY5_RHOSA|nr:glycerol-3-phosphate 1-O-acyltransferase PlsY [Rhodothalassium salexigens]MBB4210756.1 glycerol-3-phosphate acyltransferase PlsY [Rhodothalassium salexigens DSM 2132]MBK1638263.1 acyl-phosphate glycerol 3-phosphate acyltransferase [Rhodothalassium salexigens DSM 2132]TCP37688.1 acyl-phosphate glycerol-3-phosphate acyltransferase [Rhodothalassium salexigens DSM 2132]